MKTLTESKQINKRGNFPYSVSLNDTGSPITPFSTHLKIYETGREPYFLSGDYFDSLEEAVTAFKGRCKEQLDGYVETDEGGLFTEDDYYLRAYHGLKA